MSTHVLFWGGCQFHDSQLTTRGKKEIVKSGEGGDFIRFPLYSQKSGKGLVHGLVPIEVEMEKAGFVRKH